MATRILILVSHLLVDFSGVYYIYYQIRDIMDGGKKSGILKRGKKNQDKKHKRKGKKKEKGEKGGKRGVKREKKGKRG